MVVVATEGTFQLRLPSSGSHFHIYLLARPIRLLDARLGYFCDLQHAAPRASIITVIHRSALANPRVTRISPNLVAQYPAACGASFTPADACGNKSNG